MLITRHFRIAFDNAKSSFIRGLEWQEPDLIVEFKNNKKYRYHDVPEQVVSDFMAAESYGKFLHEHLKDKYKGEPIE